MKKLISFNVNGIRAVLKKGFLDFLKEHNPDFLCVQETKASKEQVDLPISESDYFQFWNSAEKKGYSGTLILSKTKPVKEIYGLNIPEHDSEGRVLTLEFEKFFLVNVYTPNAKRDLTRLKYRQVWDKTFFEFLKNLEKTKPVITCGDFNVAHNEIDLARPKDNVGNAGFTDEEREGMSCYLEEGKFIDTFRFFHKDKIKYSWWSYMFSARSKNIGWRIDYVLASNSLKDNLKNADILTEVLGSDHAPVMLEFDL